jgi:DNA-binding transcriptional regulator YdaS (Cro superfamily)
MMKSMKLKDVLNHFGTQAALARALGMSQPSVNRWVQTKRIPYLRQCQIQVVTNGQFLAATKKRGRKNVQPKDPD